MTGIAFGPENTFKLVLGPPVSIESAGLPIGTPVRNELRWKDDAWRAISTTNTYWRAVTRANSGESLKALMTDETVLAMPGGIGASAQGLLLNRSMVIGTDPWAEKSLYRRDVAADSVWPESVFPAQTYDHRINGGAWMRNASASATSRSARITGLTNGSPAKLGVRAGTGAPISVSATPMAANEAVPAAPVTLWLSPRSGGFYAQWRRGAGAPERKFQFRLDGGNWRETDPDSSRSSGRSYITIENLAAGSTHTFEVRGVLGDGTAGPVTSAVVTVGAQRGIVPGSSPGEIHQIVAIPGDGAVDLYWFDRPTNTPVVWIIAPEYHGWLDNFTITQRFNYDFGGDNDDVALPFNVTGIELVKPQWSIDVSGVPYEVGYAPIIVPRPDPGASQAITIGATYTAPPAVVRTVTIID